MRLHIFADPFSCSHQRAPHYYLESIRSPRGFWGWSCSSYIAYLLAMCPPTTSNHLVEAGENIKTGTNGMFLIDTNGNSPYALGKWTNLGSGSGNGNGGDGMRRPTPPYMVVVTPPFQNVDPLLKVIDQWAKLDTTIYSMSTSATTDDPYNNYFQSVSNSSDPYKRFQDTWFNLSGADINWHEYRRNLTNGHIDHSLFQVPVVLG